MIIYKYAIKEMSYMKNCYILLSQYLFFILFTQPAKLTFRTPFATTANTLKINTLHEKWKPFLLDGLFGVKR